MKIGVKKSLIIGICLLTLIPLLSNAISLYFQRGIKRAEIKLSIINDRKNIMGSFVESSTLTTLAYMDAIVDKDSFKVIPEIKAEHENYKKNFEEKKSQLREIIVLEENEKFFDELEKKVNTFWESGAGLLKTIENKDLSKIGDYDDNIDKINTEINELGDKVHTKLEKEFEDAQLDMKEIQSTSFIVSMITSAMSLIFGAGIGFYLVSLIGKELNKATTEISNSTGAVVESSRIFDRLGNDLSVSMQQQAEALQETVTALEEINSTVAKNAEGAEQSEAFADDCVVSAQHGKNAVSDVTNAMKKIEKNQTNTIEILNNTNRDVIELVEIIRNITDKTKIINDIVFQTKLLSFNASVEAARAGEQGKGFAVVAEEVGSLATMSGNAAKDINEILTSGTSKVEKIVEVMNKNIDSMKKESEKNLSETDVAVRECENRLQEIIQKVAELKMMSSSITRASKEQSIGVHEITKAINEIDQLTGKNNVMAKECASQAVVMTDSSESLERTIIDLKIAIDGSSRG
jgi:methyl-accepting chemotaxis protein